MKKILEQPKIIVYENVEKVSHILGEWLNPTIIDGIAVEILKTLGVSKGKKTEFNVFENNVQAVLKDGKITTHLAK